MSGQLEGRIYKLFAEGHEDQFYIGSTTQSLSQRLAGHRYKSDTEPDRKVYKYLNEYDKSIWRIELIEEYLCDNLDELRFHEGFWMDEIKPNLNTFKAGVTEQERKEHKNEYNIKYNEENKEYFKDYKKDYYKNNKDKIIEINKEYYNNNKEKIIKRFKNYYKNNKDKISENHKTKINCECGKMTTKGHISRHRKTAFHINYINSVCKEVINDIIDKLI